MSKLRKFYYDNKNQIWKNILIIVSVLFVIQIINNRLKVQNDGGTNTIQNNNNTNENINNEVFIQEGSLIDNSLGKEETIQKQAEIIKKFFDYCINRQNQEAYNLLSNDCKEELYTDFSDFEEKYIKNILSLRNVVNIENWTSNIYKVTIKEDMMATGKIDSNSIQDYITVVTENGEQKININSFIGKEKLNKTITQNEIKFTILAIKKYMDYEEYEIRVDNNTKNAILLDTKQSTKSIYLVDENNVKHYSQSHEIPDALLKINAGFSNKLAVKFTKVYSSKKTIKSLVFSDVIQNYNEYINGNKDAKMITINF